jgi:hypothetical protein
MPRPKRTQELTAKHKAIGDRIWERIDGRMSMAELIDLLRKAKASGVSSPGDFYKKLRGEEAMSQDLILDIAGILETQPLWISLGVGDPEWPGARDLTRPHAALKARISLGNARWWRTYFANAMSSSPDDRGHAEHFGTIACDAALAVIQTDNTRDRTKLVTLARFSARLVPSRRSRAGSEKVQEFTGAAARVLVLLDGAIDSLPACMRGRSGMDPRNDIHGVIYERLCSDVLAALAALVVANRKK